MKFKKTLAVILGGMLLGSCFGCESGTGAKGVLDIKAFEGGYGVQWIDDVIDAFHKYYPDIRVNVEPAVKFTPDILEAELTSNDNEVDLYFGGGFSVRKFIKEDGTSEHIEDLTEMFASNVIGESVTVKEKMNENFYYFTEYKDKNWTTHWATGNCGLYINMKALEETMGADYELPKTSNQLLEMIQEISAKEKATTDKKKKVFPVIWSGLAWDYWRYVLNVWWAQYEGVQNYRNYWKCLNEDGERTPLVYKQEGILKGLEILADVLKNEYSYTGSSVLPHTDAQAQFLLNRAVITVSGDWMENEMKANYPSSDIRYLRTPVNSALGAKLGITEEQLIAAIAAVDRGESSINGMSDEVFAEIYKARKLVFSIGSDHDAFIPKKAQDKEEAKLFLRFMASDEAMKIQYKACGTSAPYNLKYNESSEEYQSLSSFKKDTYAVSKDCNWIYFDYTDPIRFRAGLQQYYGPANQPELTFSAANASQRKTAEQVWNDEYEQVSGSWQSYLSAAGYAK